MSRVEFYGSERHYLDHLVPIAAAIPDARLLAPSNDLRQWAIRRGMPQARARLGRPHHDQHQTPVVIASRKDARDTHRTRRLALLEHGAGQTYEALPDTSHYPGGTNWDQATLILTPGPHAANAWTTSYPHTTVVQLAGTPRLDNWANHAPVASPSESPIGVAFHWDARAVCPEARGTWQEWVSTIGQLARERPVLATCHPREWPRLQPVYRHYGIPSTPNAYELVAKCGLLIADNTSLMYEWAGLGRPVLALNGSRYRRDVEHGLRFWSHVPGIECDVHASLSERVDAALADTDRIGKALGVAATMEVYGVSMFDGCATARAVAAVDEWLEAADG